MRASVLKNRETVSPHKLTILVLIREYCVITYKDSGNAELSYCDLTFTEAERRGFMIFLLKQLQSADTTLPVLMGELGEANLQPPFLQRVTERLEQFCSEEEGLVALMDFLQSLSACLLAPDGPLISKSSLIGLFIRRMILSYDSLSFSQVVDLYRQYREYYGSSRGEDLDSSVDLTASDCSADPFVGGCYSLRQAEFFVARQTHLLHRNQSEAASPTDLQQRLRQLVASNPNFAEAHYLSYLNQLRVREYCGSVHSIYHFFDRHVLPEVTTKSKDGGDDNRAFRYAALNVAALHCHFGHRQEAHQALHEAIRLAQEANDNACLQHALGWLHRLEDQSTSKVAHMMERSVSKAEKLSLWYLTSLNVQSLAKHNALATAQPSSVFEYLLKSDILNCQHSISDLMSQSCAQKASLWSLYGIGELTSMCSQTVLHLNTSERGIEQQTESEQLALCHLVRHLSNKGMHCETSKLLEILKRTSAAFTNAWWMICEQEVNFDLAVHRGKWHEAQQCAENIAIYSLSESDYRQAIVLRHTERTPKAIEMLQKLLKNEENPPEFIARCTLLLAELFCQMGNHPVALSHALECVSHSQRHHLGYWVVMSRLVLASVQYCFGLPRQALDLLDSCMVDVYASTSQFDQGRALLLYAKVHAAESATETTDRKTKGLLNAVDYLSQAAEKFRRVDDHMYAKEAVYYKALMYNELGYQMERNKCALEFRQLDDQLPACRHVIF